jgi:hypothetical protein
MMTPREHLGCLALMALVALMCEVSASADPGIPLNFFTQLPWEVATVGICGATVEFEGETVLNMWWRRNETGQLVRIVKQQPDRSSWQDERFFYDEEGRLERVEKWRSDATRAESTTAYRHADGELIATTTSYHEDRTVISTLPFGLDARGNVLAIEGGLTYSRDDMGRLLEYRDNDGVVATAEWTGTTARLMYRSLGTVEVTFDAAGEPISSVMLDGRYASERWTWLRDCSGLPPMPGEPQ